MPCIGDFMVKRLRQILYIVFITVVALTICSCKKQVKHKWIEVGSDPNPPKVKPGVHPERGSVSDAVPIVSAPIIVPTGRGTDGKLEYVKYFYDMEELTTEGIEEAMKEFNLITSSSLFCNLLIEDVDNPDLDVAAGPGAIGEKLTKKGIANFVVLESDLINEDDISKYDEKTNEGLITRNDIEECIKKTFEENYQLVSCDIKMVTMDEYRKIHGNVQ